jgi:hypothetical protein
MSPDEFQKQQDGKRMKKPGVVLLRTGSCGALTEYL